LSEALRGFELPCRRRAHETSECERGSGANARAPLRR
jgi:hypothetical protein